MRRLLPLVLLLPAGWLAILVVILALGLVGAIGIVSAAGGGDCTDSAPDPTAVKGIPRNYLAAYVKAGKRYGVDWAILAAIGSIETDHGRSTSPGVTSGVNAYGCCAGPMQFDKAGTWPAMAVDGNGDGKKDIYDPEDAIPAAARYLKASGAPGDYRRAIFAYNHATWYVNDVMARAEKYRGTLKPADLANDTAEAECRAPDGQAGPVALANARAVLRNSKIQLSPIQKSDLRAGLIDVRVTTSLVWMAQRHTIYVSAMRSDHAPGTNHNPPGRAVDVAMVDGKACTGSRSEPCGRLSAELCKMPGRYHSTEFIRNYDPCPGFQDWNEDGGDDSWPRGDHANHIHWGYDAKPVVAKYLKGGR